jgi:hypothetical protein
VLRSPGPIGTQLSTGYHYALADHWHELIRERLRAMGIDPRLAVALQHGG